MKIAFSELKKWEQSYISKNLKGHQLIFLEKPISPRSLSKLKNIEILATFIESDLTSSIIKKLPKLKLIATMSTGFDHIDLNYAKKNKIKVSHVPKYGENTVAEYTFALILALSRRIHKAIEKTRKNDFSLNDLQGFDLKNKTLGVIGPGNIGQHVIKIANGFEMNVIALGKTKNKKLAKQLNFKYAPSLNNLLKHSDIVTIHVPLNKYTKHLINLSTVKNFKPGSYLVNTARGDIVDNDALLYGLDKKIIAGAALDVLEGDYEIKEERELIHNNKKLYNQNRKLVKDKNVIITPHSAFFTKEALERILDTTIDNIKAFAKGKHKNKVA